MAKALIVDDEEGITSFLKRAVSRFTGYSIDNVIEAKDGQDALEKIVANGGVDEFNLVISDINMPRMDGYALTENLRANGYNKIIIISTGRSTNPKPEKADYLLPKPYDILKLKEVIDQYKERL